MKFFVAPLIEHRDALDHLMRFFRDGIKDNSYDKYIDELKDALNHEVRAFFDVADYICIKIRFQINNDLKHLRVSKIKKIWNEYEDVKKKIHIISKDIAEKRNSRSISQENIDAYQKMLENVLELFDDYKLNVEPKIKARKF